MTAKQNLAYFCIMLVAVVLCAGCSGNRNADNAIRLTAIPESTLENEDTDTGAFVNSVPDQPSESSADIVLPITRQIPPPEIQAQVQWFDGGATGVASVCEAVYCESAKDNSSSNIQIIQHPQSEDVLYEGIDIVLCLKGLSPRKPFTLTLKTPQGELITKSGEANADGNAKLCPYFDTLHGSYQVHLSSEAEVFNTEFEMLPPALPRIWKSGLSQPGQTFTLHYAGFEPQEVITTVWYITEEHPDYIYQSEYFTSWQTVVDNTGYAEQNIYIPPDFGNHRFVLATQSLKGTRKEWESGGYFFDLLATSVTELHIYNSSVGEELSDIRQFDETTEVIIDDSSSLLLLTGPAEGWRTAPYGYKGSTHWTYCTDEGVSNSAKWMPSLLTGYYEVFVFVPEHKAGTTQAQYRVFHNGSEDVVIVSQANYANEWVSLGKYWFAGDWQEYIYLDDNTGEPRSSNTTIAFDAVKFLYTP